MSQPEAPLRLLALVPAGEEDAVEEAARNSGLELTCTAGVGDFLSALGGGEFSATLLSLSPDPVDEGLARRVGEQPGAGTLLLSTPALTLEAALLMERAGAVSILTEPLEPDALARQLAQVLDEGPTVPLEDLAPAVAPAGEDGAPVLVGSSPAMSGIFQTLVRVAPTPSTVLITGESGTGKEVAARVIHWASPRRDEPFVAVNCAAIPENLLESELFGHEKGAFTGAVARRTGRFERAHGGTLFLDEIGDMSPVLQAKILRVLEERVVEPVGGHEPRPVDVRIVAATNQSLDAGIAEGTFREDLYYRLAVVELGLPPLRDRGEDLLELTSHFARHFSQRYDRPVSGLTRQALDRLRSHGWPGNIRELRNVLDRAVLLSSGGILRSAHLRLGAGSPRASAQGRDDAALPYPDTLSLAEVEAAHIRKVLSSVNGHMGQAAEILGIHRNTLTRKVREYGLGDGE